MHTTSTQRLPKDVKINYAAGTLAFQPFKNLAIAWDREWTWSFS